MPVKLILLTSVLELLVIFKFTGTLVSPTETEVGKSGVTLIPIPAKAGAPKRNTETTMPIDNNDFLINLLLNIFFNL